MAEFNIIGPNFQPEDTGLFLSVQEEKDGIQPELTELQDTDSTMAHLLARLGKFQSVGEGKKNGWNIPVPSGWNHITIGKAAKRWDLFIWNPNT